MLFDLVDVLQKQRRHILVALFVVTDFTLLTFCTQALQAHRLSITARIHSSESSQAAPAYQSDTLAMTASFDHAANTMEVGLLRATVATADGVTKAERAVQAASMATLHAISTVVVAIFRTAAHATLFAAHVAIFPYVAIGHGASYVFGTATRLADAHLAAVIQPKNDITVPVITLEQAKQVKLIQSGTLNFEPVKPMGSGGACDSGSGNGGYVMNWCDSPMDTVQTVSYSSDRINRECTSYTFWYFTAIEGHTDFHVTGNANRWAYTSNYPVHREPVAGAIAVETAGAYGHTAIVQALPGQTYDGKIVPNGYILVSEMNYDWQGHFRYSYSPPGKFAAYIYR